MKKSAQSFLLVLLIEAICAVANYLKERLMRHMHQDQHGYGYDENFA